MSRRPGRKNKENSYNARSKEKDKFIHCDRTIKE